MGEKSAVVIINSAEFDLVAVASNPSKTLFCTIWYAHAFLELVFPCRRLNNSWSVLSVIHDVLTPRGHRFWEMLSTWRTWAHPSYPFQRRGMSTTWNCSKARRNILGRIDTSRSPYLPVLSFDSWPQFHATRKFSCMREFREEVKTCTGR